MEKKYNKSLKLFQEALSIEPDNVESLCYIFIIYKEFKDNVQINNVFDKIRELSKNKDISKTFLKVSDHVTCHSKIRKYENALVCTDLAFELYPNNKKILRDKCYLLERLNRCNEIIQISEQYINKNSFLIYYYIGFFLGNCYYATGKYKQAANCFDKTLDINPYYHRLWDGLSTSLEKLGHPDANKIKNVAYSVNIWENPIFWNKMEENDLQKHITTIK